MERAASITRKTKETDIAMTLCLDGGGKSDIATGIGFFDHMLEGFTRHGFFDLTCQIDGDLQVDGHHTVEDAGIVLGEAIRQALGEKKAIRRYGSILLPMDEALVLCALDLSGRPWLCFEEEYTVPKIGDLDTEMIHDFFYAVTYSAGMNLHLKQISGSNNHHIAEASFKAFARALDEAVMHEPRIDGVWSTKGLL